MRKNQLTLQKKITYKLGFSLVTWIHFGTCISRYCYAYGIKKYHKKTIWTTSFINNWWRWNFINKLFLKVLKSDLFIDSVSRGNLALNKLMNVDLMLNLEWNWSRGPSHEPFEHDVHYQKLVSSGNLSLGICEIL